MSLPQRGSEGFMFKWTALLFAWNKRRQGYATALSYTSNWLECGAPWWVGYEMNGDNRKAGL